MLYLCYALDHSNHGTSNGGGVKRIPASDRGQRSQSQESVTERQRRSGGLDRASGWRLSKESNLPQRRRELRFRLYKAVHEVAAGSVKSAVAKEKLFMEVMRRTCSDKAETLYRTLESRRGSLPLPNGTLPISRPYPPLG